MAKYFYISQEYRFIETLYGFLHQNSEDLSKLTLLLPSQRSAREFKRIVAELSGADRLPNIINYSEIVSKYNHFISEIFHDSKELLNDTDIYYLILNAFPNMDDSSLVQIQNFLVEFFSFSSEVTEFSNDIKNNILKNFKNNLDGSGYDIIQLKRKIIVEWLESQPWHNQQIYAVFPLNNTLYAKNLLNFLTTLPQCNFIFHGKNSYCYGEIIPNNASLQPITGSYKNTNPKIEYIEGCNLYETAGQISFIIREFFHLNKNGKIALITENNDLAKYCKNIVKQWNIETDDTTPVDISTIPDIKIFFEIFEFLLKPEIKKFVSLLALLNIDITNLYKKIITKKPFINLKGLINAIENSAEFENITSIYNILTSNSFPQNDSLQNFFTLHKYLFEKIFTKTSTYIGEISELIEEVKISYPLSKTKYISLVKKIINKHKFHNIESYSRFLILTPIEARLLSFNTVVIADCHFGKNKNNRSYMLEQNALADKINLEKIENSYADLDVKHLVSQPKVFITRNMASNDFLHPALEKLVINLKPLKKYSNWLIKKNSTENIKPVAPFAYSSTKVEKLSPTSIELYMHNPYLFYAKYILGLREINLNTDISKQFGIIVHSIISGINKIYNDADSLKNFMLISLDNELKAQNIHEIWLKHLWQNKIIKIADWLLPRLKHNSTRESKISTTYKNTTIEATADEIAQNGNDFLIIDYKTGSIPSKKDIAQGIKPQLLVEMMILHQSNPESAIALEYRQINPPKLKQELIKYDADSTIKQIHTLINSINKGEFFATYNDGFDSSYKHFLRLEEWRHQ